jgi:hypothetical protein
MDVLSLRDRLRDRWADEVGEGVISTAIAVLIVALLGAAMWVGFNQLWTNAEGRIQDSVNQIGG